MLILSVRTDESIHIGDDTTITLIAKLTGEVVLQVNTEQIITIDSKKSAVSENSTIDNNGD